MKQQLIDGKRVIHLQATAYMIEQDLGAHYYLVAPAPGSRVFLLADVVVQLVSLPCGVDNPHLHPAPFRGLVHRWSTPRKPDCFRVRVWGSRGTERVQLAPQRLCEDPEAAKRALVRLHRKLYRDGVL